MYEVNVMTIDGFDETFEDILSYEYSELGFDITLEPNHVVSWPLSQIRRIEMTSYTYPNESVNGEAANG